MSCLRQSTARKLCLDISGGTLELYSAKLARRKECQIEEGHLMPDHVHMLISIPPKYSVAEVIGLSEGEEFDLGRAERGAKSSQFSWSQVLGQRIFRFNGREGRGDDPHLSRTRK